MGNRILTSKGPTHNIYSDNCYSIDGYIYIFMCDFVYNKPTFHGYSSSDSMFIITSKMLRKLLNFVKQQVFSLIGWKKIIITI